MSSPTEPQQDIMLVAWFTVALILSFNKAVAGRTDERLEARPEGGEGGDPRARDPAAVHVHLPQPGPTLPARLLRSNNSSA